MKRPSLDDPRWRPLADVYQARFRQTRSATLAARDITDALLQGLGCMTRKVNLRLAGPDRELRPPELWKDYELNGRSNEEVLITRRSRGEGARQVMPIRSYAFFLWGPDVDKAWTSAKRRPQAKTETAPRKRVKTDKMKAAVPRSRLLRQWSKRS